MKSMRGCILAICFFFILQGVALGAGPVKIAVVDMNRLQHKSASFKKVRGTLEKRVKTMQQKLDAEKNALLKMEEDFKKQSMMLSLDAQEEKKAALEKKRRYYKYLYEDFTIEMQNLEKNAKVRIGKELNDILKKIAQDQGLSIIFERRTIGLLFYDDVIDITDQVVKAYDSKK
jgi:outer membrane protein